MYFPIIKSICKQLLIYSGCIIISLLVTQTGCTNDPVATNIVNNAHHVSGNTDTISGKVIKISDGDTFHMLLSDKTTIKIRLHGIDCPERSQPFYQQARNYLSDLIYNKNIQIIVPYKDQYKRHVAFAFFNGISVNEKMLENGFAWHFKRHDKQIEWENLEKKARKEKKGIWSDPNPVAPWKYRNNKKVAY